MRYLIPLMLAFTTATAQYPGGVSNSNLKLWLKADFPGKILYNGVNQVSSWESLDPNNFVFTQSTPLHQPIFAAVDINFNPAVTSVGNAYMRVLGLPLSSASPFTIFNVNRYTGVPGIVISQGAASTGASDPTVLTNGQAAFSNMQIIQGNNFSDNIPRIYRIERNPSPVLMSNYANAISIRTNISLQDPAALIMDSTCIIGRMQNTPDLVNSLDGAISEIIAFNTVLGPSDYQRIESYLAVKYGITLGNTADPVDYLNSSSTVTWTGSPVYQNNIAGIGRDDNSTLLQKQSRSVTSGIVTVAITGAGSMNDIPVSNAQNLGSFTRDNSFLIWGDNAVSPEGVAIDLPAGIALKSGRIWKSQLTGTGLNGQNIRLRFDLSSFISSITTLDNYRLLLDADGTFTTGAISILPAKGDLTQRHVEFDVVMADYPNYYFTIATTNNALSPLPLDFLKFSAESGHSEIRLDWSTTNERNTHSFVIERSSDLKQWTPIGTINAQNSAGTHHYSYIDNQPATGLNYYRLRQTDWDGAHSFSETVSAQLKQQSWSYHLQANALELNNHANIQRPFTIHTVDGKLIQKGSLPAKQNTRVSTVNWATGIYILRVSGQKPVRIWVGKT